MTSIYIDDTGTPGIKSKSVYDTVDKKTWMALILNSEQKSEAEIQMKGCIQLLKEEFNASEFHFTDIYSGKNEFKNITLEKRMGIFKAFAEIFRQMKYPMLIQTFTSDDILRNRFLIEGKNIKIDNFRLSDTGDFALFFLLFRIKKYLVETKVSLPVEIIIDEGRQKKNTTQKCDLLKGYLYNDVLSYRSSSSDHLLQLIDYAAFFMNKVRWIQTNDKKTDLDYELLRIAERADFNILNVVKQKIHFDDNLVAAYDNILRGVYEENNALSGIEFEELKKKLSK